MRFREDVTTLVKTETELRYFHILKYCHVHVQLTDDNEMGGDTNRKPLCWV